MTTLLDPELQKQFLKNLFSWYKKNGRHDMAWRHTDDPYRILVSEFMLQQTTVATVGPYYDRFVRAFPTLKSLADADLNDVLALWSGLGYYARARNLWAAVREIQSKFNGEVPSDQAQLKKLPGVGNYISGAISTIAHNQPATVLDGNIIRVFMRVLALEDDPKLKAVQSILQQTSQNLNELAKKGQKTPLQKKWAGPRHLSLALMDLGATVCIPRGPKCGVCPLSDLCLANKFGRQDSIPLTAETLERPTVRWVHAVIESKSKWLMGQKPKEGLFGGLWEFPGFEIPKAEEPVPFLEKNIEKETGLSVRVQEAMTAFEHQLTHRIFVIRPFISKIKSGRLRTTKQQGFRYDRFKWVGKNSIQKTGISSITKRIFGNLKTNPPSPKGSAPRGRKKT